MHHTKRRSLLPDWSSCCTQTSSSATSCPTSLGFLHYVLKPVGHNCILPLRVLICLQFVRGSMSFINTKESATCPCTIQNVVACYPIDRRVVHKLQVGQRRVPRPWLFCTMFWSLLAIIAFCLSVCSFACNLYGGVWVLSIPRSRNISWIILPPKIINWSVRKTRAAPMLYYLTRKVNWICWQQRKRYHMHREQIRYHRHMLRSGAIRRCHWSQDIHCNCADFHSRIKSSLAPRSHLLHFCILLCTFETPLKFFSMSVLIVGHPNPFLLLSYVLPSSRF